MSADPLSLIEEHVSAMAALTLTDEDELPEPPDLSSFTLESGDLARAHALLRDLASAAERLSGMQVRVQGELEGMRRPRRERLRPAPRVLDTSA